MGLITLWVALALSTNAASGSEFAAMGVGTTSCADFAIAFKNNPTAAEYVYFQWALGYMSGQNLAPALSGKAFRDLRSVTADSQMISIRAYCDRHPLATYLQAVSDVYDSLDETADPSD